MVGGYAYSNTDNIVVGLIAEQATGRSYPSLLSSTVFRPAGPGTNSAGLATFRYPTG